MNQIVDCWSMVPPKFSHKGKHFELNLRIPNTNTKRWFRLRQAKHLIHWLNWESSLFIPNPHHLVLQLRISNLSKTSNKPLISSIFQSFKFHLGFKSHEQKALEQIIRLSTNPFLERANLKQEGNRSLRGSLEHYTSNQNLTPSPLLTLNLMWLKNTSMFLLIPFQSSHPLALSVL